MWIRDEEVWLHENHIRNLYRDLLAWTSANEDARDSFGKAWEQMKSAMEKLNITAHELRGEEGVLVIR